MIIEEKFGKVDEDGVILCPECGSTNVHIEEPELLPAPNMYHNGIGAVFSMWCEHCDAREYWRMCIGFHKGSTYLSWFRDRPYDD